MSTKAGSLRLDLQKAHEALSTDPQQSKRLAERVLDSAHEIPELLGETLTALGAARHYCGDREGARSAYRSAFDLEACRVKRGSILCRWALLELDRHNAREALEKACQGIALVESGACSNRELARALLARATVYLRTDRYEDGEYDTRLALRVMHPRKDDDLHYTALHNLSAGLLWGKRNPKSINRLLVILDEVKQHLRRHRITKNSVQNGCVIYARGLANKLAGSEERAEVLFRESQSVFFAISAITDWLRVSLDLIELYMHHQRWGRVKLLAAEMLRYADDAETIAVLRVFYEAVAGDHVEMTEEILTAVYTKIHGDIRRVPQLVTPRDIDELDVEPLGW